MNKLRSLLLVGALLPASLISQTPAPATVDELMADPGIGGQIAYEVTLPNYGFFIHQKGYLVGVHDKGGKILINDIAKFILQRQVTNEAGQVSHEHAGWVNDEAVVAEIKETKEGMDRAFEIVIDAPNLNTKLLVVCKPDGPVINFKMTAKGFPEEGGFSAVFPLNFNKTNVDTSEVEENVNPVVIYGPEDKSLSITYSQDFKPFNTQGPAVVVNKSGMTFYPFAGLNPVTDGTEIPLELILDFGK